MIAASPVAVKTLKDWLAIKAAVENNSDKTITDKAKHIKIYAANI